MLWQIVEITTVTPEEITAAGLRELIAKYQAQQVGFSCHRATVRREGAAPDEHEPEVQMVLCPGYGEGGVAWGADMDRVDLGHLYATGYALTPEALVHYVLNGRHAG